MGTLDGSVSAARNRTLLLIGVAGALGNSDLAAMRLEDLKWHEKGITLDLSRPIEHGAKHRAIKIPFGGDQPCPVKALKDWLVIAKLKGALVFRSVGTFGTIGEGIHPNSIGGAGAKTSYGRHIYSLRVHTGDAPFGEDARLRSVPVDLIGRWRGKRAPRRKLRYGGRPFADQIDKRAAVAALGAQARSPSSVI